MANNNPMIGDERNFPNTKRAVKRGANLFGLVFAVVAAVYTLTTGILDLRYSDNSGYNNNNRNDRGGDRRKY